MKVIRVGILGLGTVGGGVVRLLEENGPMIDARLGARLQVKRIARRRPDAPASVAVDPALLTADPLEVIRDPAIQIVVELIGGTEEARRYALEALRAGKHLVTANKALLATHGLEIYRAAAERKLDLGFEAAVCGGIPIIRALRDGLVANRIRSLLGIINGTANYILTKMTEQGRPFAEVLAEAQAKGYAEADPTLDVGGHDAAHKLQILASIAYNTFIALPQVPVEGIAGMDPSDIRYARELGYVVKLLAIAKLADGELEVRVSPTLIPEDHLLASVRGVYNGVYLVGDAVGPQMFYGRGAGEMPTASAVVSDIVEIAANILAKRPSRQATLYRPGVQTELALKPLQEIRTRYYLRVMVNDKPGVLSKVSGVLGNHNVSIASVIQKARHEQEAVPIVMMTHEAREGDLKTALAAIDRLDVVSAKTICLRVEES
ncbi:MAG: homoserine dehydrogenase [Candidatus Methylomirabilales bacterium]